MPRRNPSRLIYAASERHADQLYATGFRAPDAFAFVQSPAGRTAILLSDLEIDRGRREARVDVVESLTEWQGKLRGSGTVEPEPAAVIAAFARKHGAARPLVPADFPAGLAFALAAHGVEVKPVAGHLWPGREFKSAAEVRSLAAASRLTEIGLARALEVLGAAEIRKDRRLVWGGGVLTAERLRAEIESAILFAGGVPDGTTIVAGGGQACDPHERGHGPLRAHELIILDVFPRAARTGFYGDLTRTVVRGAASEAQRRLWETCLEGQRRALRALRPDVEGRVVMEDVRAYFAAEGYPTEQRDGRWTGFFHGLGHGLGLELHEEPRLGKTTLRPGQVFTVEPGIYVPGLGGVRHEDVVVITETGSRVISRFPKPLEV